MANHLEDHVLISLSTQRPDFMTFPERRLVLTKSRPDLQIGRASNRPALGLQSQQNNGWFDSPVMSRHHAKICADIEKKSVYIEDSKSMHGTYVNGDKVAPTERRLLATGDKLVFGMAVYRNQQTFQPAEVEIGVDFQAASQLTTSPSRKFSVPDDCSTDENEPMEEDVTVSVIAGPEHADNKPSVLIDTAGKEAQNEPMEEAVPIPTKGYSAEPFASTLGPVKDDEPSELPAISQVDGPMDEDESIRLTDSSDSGSEYSTPSLRSPSDLENLLEVAIAGYRDDESVSDFWSRRSDDGANGDTNLNNSEEEASVHEDVFIYDSEDSEELDDDFDPIDEDFDEDQPQLSKALKLIPLLPGLESPSETSETPLLQQDTVLSLATFDPARSPPYSSASCIQRDNWDFSGSGVTSAFDLQKWKQQTQELGRAENPWLTATGLSAYAVEGPLARPFDSPNPWSLGSFTGNSAVPHQETRREFGNPSTLGFFGDNLPMKHCPPQKFTKGKRKAEDISTSTDAEIEALDPSISPFTGQQLRHLPIRDDSKSVTGTSAPVSRTSASIQTLPSPPTTPEQQTDRETRPVKKVKRFAERVGFAALGGATVGALVFSSLVYTAPNFV